MARNTSGLKRGGSPGRKKGVPNKATQAFKAFATMLLEDPEVQQTMLEQARAGKLPPALWTAMITSVIPKAKETIEIQGLEAFTLKILTAGEHADA